MLNPTASLSLSSKLSVAAPAVSALCALALCAPFQTGCSVEVAAPQLSEPPPPPALLSIAAPLQDARLSAVDDVRLDVPGLQVDIRVQVEDVKNGLHLETVQLITPEGDVISAPVTSTRENGRQALFTSVTLLTAPQGALNSLLVAASEDIPDSETWIHVHAAGPDVRADACDAPVIHQGDVVLAEGTLPFDAPPNECVILEGNLRIEETEADRVGELDGVVEVTGDVIISTNAVLRELEGLQGLASIGGDLYITHNPELPTEAGAIAFRDSIGLDNIGGTAFISGNGPG